MHQEEITNFVLINLKGKKPIDIVKDRLMKLETSSNCFLKKINSQKDPNMIVYSCESLKCPFHLCFTKTGKQSLCLSSY